MVTRHVWIMCLFHKCGSCGYFTNVDHVFTSHKWIMFLFHIGEICGLIIQLAYVDI